MLRSDFHYQLPGELIAQEPLPERSASRLLALDGATGALTDARVRDLPTLLRPGDLLVLNDSRVVKARLHGRKDTGGAVELLVERVEPAGSLLAQVRASKAPRAGSIVHIADGVRLQVLGREGDLFRLEAQGLEVAELLERHGSVPLPPYIHRAPRDSDAERYQTVYARTPGSVAAPTAGLHFDDALLGRLAEAGVRSAHLTLHVGAGTFQPVRTERVDEHVMHAERLTVPQAVADAVAATRAAGGRVVAVGTTSVRSLEAAAAAHGGALRAWEGETDLFIRPGYRFQVVDAMLTNFHLPESTLLMLVCAFGGTEAVLAAYRHAVAQRYRFFSYGDAMLVTRAPGAGD